MLRHYRGDKLQWIHIELQAKQADGVTSSTTLAVWDANCYAYGFKNQSGVWYDLIDQRGSRKLPAQYNAVLLDWGVSYKHILGIGDVYDYGALKTKLNGLKLGRSFAMEAVRTLSRYPDLEEGVKPREALAGLLIMLCESAKFNHLRDHFRDGWDVGAVFGDDNKPRLDYIWRWGLISHTLLEWKKKGCWEPPTDGDGNARKQLEDMGIKNEEDAVRSLHFIAKEPWTGKSSNRWKGGASS